jgi:hypothetical protein
MNWFGHLAQDHWKTYLPSRYSQIPDPESYFSTFVEEIEEQIETLTFALAGDDQPGEGALGKTGRLTAARQQAREKILTEQVLLPAEPGSPMDENSPGTRVELGLEPEDEQEPTPPRPAGQFVSDWIPVTEDPSHPWWETRADQEEID